MLLPLAMIDSRIVDELRLVMSMPTVSVGLVMVLLAKRVLFWLEMVTVPEELKVFPVMLQSEPPVTLMAVLAERI